MVWLLLMVMMVAVIMAGSECTTEKMAWIIRHSS